MLRAPLYFDRYNEFIIDGGKWAHQLPDVIDAFLASTEGTTEAHEAFLGQYGLTASEVPLLAWNCDCSRPFNEGSRASADPCRHG